jgi:AAA domain
VVLRPTKSVSILYGLGDPATGRAVLAAHHAGLADAVGYLDEHLGAQWAVQATRKAKQHETPDTLYGRWRQEAAERGVDPDTLVRAVTGRTANRQQDWMVSDAVTDPVFDRLTGPEGLTAQGSTFTRPDVLVALGAGLAGAGRTELEALADRFLAEREVSLADRTLEERRWSTPELLAVEQRLVAAATGRTGEQTAKVSHEAVREALAAHPSAGADQQAMVRDVCQGGAGVALVVGRAGTGKTFALGIAATPGNSTATGCSLRPRLGSPA